MFDDFFDLLCDFILHIIAFCGIVVWGVILKLYLVG